MWQYTWNANGSLKSVKKPSGQTISFEYDALGRRTKKFVKDKTIHYIWSGNVLLHEIFDNGNEQKTATYVYEQRNFVPTAKLVDNESFSIVSDYIGRPIQVYDQNGEKVWSAEYDIYGKLTNLQGDKAFIPFRQLGQYEDVETGLYYNRFRYYDCNTGTYISQDPIRLAGGLAFYAYVHDVNGWVDIFGLHGNELTNITDSILYDIKINGTQFKYGIADATRTIKKDILVVQPNGNIAVIPKGTAVRLHQQLRKAYSNFDDVQVSSTLFKQKTTAFMKDKENRLISKFVQSNGKVPSGNKAHALKGLGSLADDFNGIHDLRKDLKMKNNKAKHH